MTTSPEEHQLTVVFHYGGGESTRLDGLAAASAEQIADDLRRAKWYTALGPGSKQTIVNMAAVRYVEIEAGA